MTIPDKYAFWRWPAKIRRLSTELEQLKTEHQRVLAGQSAVLEWVKITHRLDSKAEGIRALIQQGKRIIPLLFLFVCQSLWAQPAPPILRQPLTTNSHFGPVPTEGQVPIWNDTAKKWSNGLISAGASTPHTWTNDNGTLKPIAFPTNILFRVVVPDDGISTNFYFDSRVYRTNGASKLFQIYNGGSNALTVGPYGGLFMGRGNATPFPGAVLYGIFDTALGETNQQEIFTLSGNSAVGYSGASDLIIDTNYGALILFANKEGGTKFTRFSIQAGGGINPENFNNFTMQGLVDGATYFQVDPSFTLFTPTNYLFSSSVRITNTDTLLSLQNSNFPVLEVDGVGDLRLIKKVPYLWPSAQGAAGTALTNNGSGALGWWPVSAGAGSPGLTTNANQFLGVPLSIKSGALLTNTAFHGGITMTNSDAQTQVLRVDTTFTTNALSVGSNGITSIRGSTRFINIGESSAAGFVGFAIDSSAHNPTLGSDAGFFSDGGNVLFNYPAGAGFYVTENTANKVTVGRGGTDGFVGIGTANETPSALLSVGTGSRFQVDSTGTVRSSSIIITNLPGATPEPFLRIAQTNGRGYAEFTTTNSVIATNRFVLSIGSNTVSAGQLFRVHSTAISAGINNIVVTNDSGTDFQPASANLTNWSNIPTGAMANVVSTTFLTNWANAISNYVTAATNSASVTNWITTRQPADAVLSNLVGTVARNVTNFISLSTTNATSKPLTNSYTAGVLTMFGIEQGSGHAITMNASNIVSANDWAQTASTTNVVGVSNWVNSVSNYVTSATNSASVTNWITQRQPASANLTNWSNIPTGAMANVVATDYLTNWANAISNLAQTKGITNTPIVAVGNLHVTNQLLRANEHLNGGTVFTNLDFTGSIIKTMTNAITGSRTNNLTNAVGGASMIVYVVGETATATDRNYTFTAASANIRWMNSPTNANAIDVLIHSNQVYTFRFDVVTNATGPETNIIASWSTDSQRPILNRLVPVSAGAGTSNAWVEGRVFLDAVTATTNHTGTDNYTNLFTFTVPGNTLTNEEDEVEFYLSGQSRFHTATTNSLKCIYGTSTIFDTGFITASNCPWKASIRITRTGNSSQRVEAEVRWNVNAAIGSFGNGTLSTYATNMPLAQVNGATNIFVFQGKSRIAAAITNDYKLVRWNPGTRGSVP